MSKVHVSVAMMMTAGLGTRLSPFTQVQTKALMPVLGIPSAQYTIDTLVAAGVNDLIANVHHRAESTRQGLLSLDYAGSRLLVSDESDELLGTAGGLRKAIPYMGQGPVLRANADVICNIDWLSLMDRHQYLRRKKGVSITMALLQNTTSEESYPEILLHPDSEQVIGLGKSIRGGVFWSGAAVIELEALAQIPQKGPSEFVPWVLSPAIREQKVGAVLMDTCWYDIGSPRLWLQTHLDLLKTLEEETSSARLCPKWRERLLKQNVQLASGVWVDRKAPRLRQDQLHPPVYVGSIDEAPSMEESHEAIARVELGPRCVLYGESAIQGKLQRGIGYSRLWMGED